MSLGVDRPFFPKPVGPNSSAANISVDQPNMLITDKKRIREIRERLSGVSWLMRSLNEYKG
jgi:hypothetical protein